MQAIELGCKKCGSEDFELLDAKTGEVLCNYCRNRWIEPSLIRQTETEKFLAEQAKRPQVVVDNTTETDKQLMDMITKAAGISAGGCLKKIAKFAFIALIIAIVITVLVVFGLSQLSS